MSDEAKLALFIDFENMALGAEEEKLPTFEVDRVLRLADLKDRLRAIGWSLKFDSPTSFRIRGAHSRRFEARALVYDFASTLPDVHVSRSRTNHRLKRRFAQIVGH